MAKRPRRRNNPEANQLRSVAAGPERLFDDLTAPFRKVVEATETTRNGLRAVAGEMQQAAEKLNAVADKLDLIADGLDVILRAPILQRFRNQ